MINWQGLWFPENETHLLGWIKANGHYRDGAPTYQYHKYEEALKQCKQKRVAIDVGGNIGLWSRVMSLDFQEVKAFEPVADYCDYFRLNAPKTELFNVALGHESGKVTMACATNGSCGDTSPLSDPENEVIVAEDVDMIPLDAYNFKNVDFIKIDCEGYELHVLKGAIETIVENQPVIIVEQKKGHGQKFGYADDAAAKYLQEFGMKVHKVISGDYIMVW